MNDTDIRHKDFALRLSLKERLRGTWKKTVRLQVGSDEHSLRNLKPFDCARDDVVQLFNERYSQRMPLVDAVFGETRN